MRDRGGGVAGRHFVRAGRCQTLYVLEDASVQGLRPEGWSRRVANGAARWNTVHVVAEANNGGATVESVLKAADLGLKVRLVHASKGKSARAEPIALKFEVGKALFAGLCPQLEAELVGMGEVRCSSVTVGGVQVLGSPAAPIAAPAGGRSVDAEARSAIQEILSALRAHGLVKT